MKRALVTGGAGLIGSHVTDLLLAEDWRVRVLDNLEPNTHKRGKPAWINPAAEFIEGDLRGRETITAALDNIDIVFHQAAYGGYMPEIAKYVHVNSLGTAQMLEVIREKKLPIKKIVVASSQAVYSEGAATCPEHGLVFPDVRPVEQLQAGDWSVHCPICQVVTRSAPTPERAPVGGETVYGLTKVDQEKLVLLWGKQIGIPTVALRYSCTYGPRQSIFNPYTGVIAIFCTRLLNDLPPVLYEDGEQTRDFVHVSDIVRANLLALQTDAADYQAINVGTGRPTSVRTVSNLLAQGLGLDLEPEIVAKYREGDIRHCVADISKAKSLLGYEPQVSLEQGIPELLSWVRAQAAQDQVESATAELESRQLVR